LLFYIFFVSSLTMRLSWVEYGCLIAASAASRSEDPHTKVGACILNEEGRIVSTGYNGLKSGVNLPQWMHDEKNRPKKRELMIHAETNALSFIRKGEGDTMCLTMSPCFACAKDIAANQIKRVFYIEQYSQCDKFKEIFDFYGIYYKQLTKDSIQKIKSHLSTWIK